MKKFIVLLMTLVLMISFTACKAGTPVASMTIDPETGAGTKTFAFKIPKNDVDGVDNNFGEGNYVKDVNALAGLFSSKLPDTYKIEVKDTVVEVKKDEKVEDEGYYTISVTYSYDSIDDYNTKTKALIGEELWAAENAKSPLSPATLTSKEENGKKVVTFNEDMRILQLQALWAAKVCFEDTTGAWTNVPFPVYENNEPVVDENGNPVMKPIVEKYDQLVSFDDSEFALSLGDKTETFRYMEYDKVNLSAELELPKPTAAPATPATPEETPVPVPASSNENPKTGAESLVQIAVMTLLSGGTLIISRKRK